MRLDKIGWLFVFIFLLASGKIFGQFDVQLKRFNSKNKFENTYKSLLEKPKWLFGEEVCPLSLIPKFETKVYYLSEGCADDAEICLNNCQKDDGNACYALALLVQEKKSTEQFISEALLARACQLGVTSGCTNRAAAILKLQENDEKAVKCAGDTFEKTCERDDPWGCTMFGRVLYFGLGRPRDFEKALVVLSKSCKYGDVDPACVAAKSKIEDIKNPPINK